MEVSVFGRGFGEALVVHLGDGKWALIDSCRNPGTGRPAGMEYLETLGVDPGVSVVLIVVTHWDDDHVEGVAETAAACTSAALACSAALCREEVIEFVLEQDDAGSALGSGVDELRTILRIAAGRGGVIWAKANLPLYPRPPGDSPIVVALSPSEDAVERSILSIIELAVKAG
jgi:glyoxylase-like metal-dependent hydrolase (beta-lactamase superfamily II)